MNKERTPDKSISRRTFLKKLNAVAAIAGVENALGIEVHTALAYVAHLGFGSTALGGDWCFVE